MKDRDYAHPEDRIVQAKPHLIKAIEKIADAVREAKAEFERETGCIMTSVDPEILDVSTWAEQKTTAGYVNIDYKFRCLSGLTPAMIHVSKYGYEFVPISRLL